MLKRVAFLDPAGKITTRERSAAYLLRELDAEGNLVESFGLTAVLEDPRRANGVLENTVIVVPGDEKEFERISGFGRKSKGGGVMAKKKKAGGEACPLGKEFVFRTPDGREVGKARNLGELASLMARAPLASVLYHANGGHFGPWLEMMGRPSVAQYVSRVKGTNEQVRKELLDALA